MEYCFWGADNADCRVVTEDHPGIGTPHDMYDALCHVWCAETCAPRMRKDWTKDNMTMGQCSVTAFLVQDFFGGEVLGILLPDGNYHCFNRVGNCAFDLTSEQFPEGELDYTACSEQFKEDHFAKEEKKQRYILLKERLRSYLNKETI